MQPSEESLEVFVLFVDYGSSESITQLERYGLYVRNGINYIAFSQCIINLVKNFAISYQVAA